MDLRGLAFVGCRLLALFLGIQLLTDLPAVAAKFLSAPKPGAGLLAAMLMQHGGFVLNLLASVALWCAARRMAEAIAGPASSWWGVRRSNDELRHAVFAAAGALVLAAVINDLAHLYLLARSHLMDASGAVPLYAVAASGCAAAAKIALGLWLLLGAPGLARLVGQFRAQGASANGDTSVAQMLTDLALTLRNEAEGIAKRVVRSSLDAVIAAVEQRKPDFSAATAVDGTVTIVFSDMEGFTAMTQRLGDREAHEVIKVHNCIVRQAVKAHGGKEVELQGDGFLLAFPDVAQALRCACAIQRDCAAYSVGHADRPIRVRIGLHTGKPIKEGERFFGLTVILAARIAAQAGGGETLVSEAVHRQLADTGEFTFDAGREAELKGLDGRHRMFGVRHGLAAN